MKCATIEIQYISNTQRYFLIEYIIVSDYPYNNIAGLNSQAHFLYMLSTLRRRVFVYSIKMSAVQDSAYDYNLNCFVSKNFPSNSMNDEPPSPSPSAQLDAVRYSSHLLLNCPILILSQLFMHAYQFCIAIISMNLVAPTLLEN